jgi:hypothetical protein
MESFTRIWRIHRQAHLEQNPRLLPMMMHHRPTLRQICFDPAITISGSIPAAFIDSLFFLARDGVIAGRVISGLVGFFKIALPTANMPHQ